MMRTSEVAGESARWPRMLQEYELRAVHRAGLENAVAGCCGGMPPEGAEDQGWKSREELGMTFWGGVYEDVEAVSNPATRLAYHYRGWA